MVAFRIVVFYAEKHGRMHQHRGDASGPRQIELLYRSALLTNPDVSLTVLTTAETDLAALRVPHERIDGTVDFDRIMFERTRMQREYLARAPLSHPIAFLDTDILFLRDLGPVFADDFDVALTSRRNREMPFNGGVILVNNRRPEAALRFFGEFERIYREQRADSAEWYGDQFALADAVGLDPDRVPDMDRYEDGGVRYRFLPCAIYNDAPSANTKSLLKKPGDTVLKHFKGGARRLMEPYWRFYIAPEHRSDPWRGLRLAYTLASFAISKRAYHRSQKRDGRRQFNCDGQNTRSWHERAEVAGELFELVLTDLPRPARVVDLGCGDGKLQDVLGNKGHSVNYAGYDLFPQHPDVSRLDLSRDAIPGEAHLVFVLGVFEYLADTVAALRRIRQCAPWLIVSHAASDLRKITPSRAKKLNWQTYVSVAEFEARLSAGGYRVIERRLTPDRKTCVWLCRADAEALPESFAA